MTAAEAKAGDRLRTSGGGVVTVKSVWVRQVAGKERIGIALTNGIVYTNLHPRDQLGGRA